MKDFLRRLIGHKPALFGAAVVLAMIVTALAAPVLSPHEPLAMNFDAIQQPPSGAYWFGTDSEGRDVLTRVMYGAQISLQVAAVSVSIALLIGTTLGVLGGYFGKTVDLAVTRVTDMLFAFPEIVLALVIMAALGASRTNLMIAIGVVYTPIFARIARAEVLSVRRQPYIEAARAVGLPHRRIMLRHVVPNILGPLLVQTTLSLAFAILAEAALSFLGLGVEPDAPSWGNMLQAGKERMRQAWWMAVFPGVAITLAVLGFNLLGDGLRDVLDPRGEHRSG
jgi:peptide/nickel transport system permease protein